MHSSGSLDVRNGAVVNVSSGGSISSASTINVGSSAGGTLIVDGAGSSAVAGDAGSLPSNWGNLPNTVGTANVTFSNNASGTFLGGIELAGTAIVNVQSGADLTTGFIGLGRAFTSSAAINVQGSGSTLTQSGAVNLIVGDNSGGTAVINVGTTGSGAMLSTGAGTLTINVSGTVNIGSDANTGTLNANGDVTINDGTLTRGSGSAFNLAVGKTMTVENGGSASFTGSYITATDAIYNVSGIGSALEAVAGGISINNAAQVHISSGGLLSSAGNFLIGNGGNGTLTVDGSGSSLVSAGPTNAWGRVGNTAAVTFSNNAIGTLSGNLNLAETSTASSTAVVDVLSGADLCVGGSITLTAAGGATNSATLNVQGNGSTFTQSGAGTLSVGNITTGSAVINIGTTSGGAVLTTGTGAMTIKTTGTVTVGSSAGTGTLNANGDVTINGGSFTRSSGSNFNLATGHTLTVDNGGSAVINGSHTTAANTIYNVTGSGSQFESGSLGLGAGAELNVSSSGSVTADSLGVDAGEELHVSSGGSVTTSGSFGVSGTLVVEGPGSTLVVGDSANVGGAGTFDVLSDADVNITFFCDIGTFSGASATLNVEGAGSSFTVNNGSLNAVDIGHATNGTATLNIGTTTSGGTFTSAGGIEVNPTGVVTVGSATTTGTLNVNTIFKIDGGAVHFVNGVVNADAITLANGGTFEFDGGTLHIGQFTGDLANDGGTLAPGQSPGITTVTGSYTQQAAGTLQIEIGGLTPGSQYDRLTIAGSASLGGVLELSLYNGFQPRTGDFFANIYSAAAVTGAFASVTGTNLGGSLLLNPISTATSLSLLAAFPGDANLDTVAEFTDLGILLNNYNTGGFSGIAQWNAGDFNDDHSVDFIDLGILLNNYNQHAPISTSAAPVPEPGTLVLATVGLIGIGMASRRRLRT